ncbi:hypothetical protein NFI96_013919 [Prochilodus magdalenae]|nr:hypothetical protein NFI96_013919 [Prochilodus magdalenae]
MHLHPVCCIKMSTPEEIKAVRGETVTLSCSFTSNTRATNLLSVDWSFRPQSGGPTQNLEHPHTVPADGAVGMEVELHQFFWTCDNRPFISVLTTVPPHTDSLGVSTKTKAGLFFHFFSKAYPPQDGHFKGRVKWLGGPSRGDASIQLLNASLNDNGTYACAVRNPPDVHGQASQTILTVTPKKVGVRFSDVAVLLLLVIVPSGLIAVLLLVRMLCPCCSPVEKSSSLGHHSPIEVTDGGVVPDCHGVTQNGSGSSSVTSPALVLVETPNESVCGGTVVSTKMSGVTSHVQKAWCPSTSTPTAPSAGAVEEYIYKQPKQKAPTCCELYFMDSDEEEYYYHHEKYQMKAIPESQC